MATSVFDPVAYKQTTREQWQETAEAWNRWGPTLERWLGPATELMLDRAQGRRGRPGPRPGGRRRRARRSPRRSRVGPRGSVLATDISAAILDYAAAAGARRRPRQRRGPGAGRRGARRPRGRQLRRGHLSASASSTSPTSSARCAGSIAYCARAAVLSAIVYSTAGAQPVLLDPGHDHPAHRRPAGTRARDSLGRSASAAQASSRRPTRTQGSRTCTCDALDAPRALRDRGRVRPLRTRVIRRPPRHARGREPGRPRAGLARDRDGASGSSKGATDSKARASS